ncbi:MAG: cytochrome c biogenesis protein CcsA [Muribaculaceae bacterium]|nr:cytochrome c biogenesis protein CcsA [Muribaculaceae bacterium]
MLRKPFTLLIHIALAVIIIGALVTHFCGIQGEVTLPVSGQTTNKFIKSSGPGDAHFPFTIRLEDTDIDFYPGTTTPMDFHSTLEVAGQTISVSMNKVGEYQGWRFYQSGIAPDSSTLAVSYDPWGTGITYLGYLLLGLGMIGFFFQKKTAWRALLHKRVTLGVMLLLACSTASAADTDLPCMQRPLAANLGKAYVYWNDRICPIQTMAHDVTSKLYGSGSYKGMTPEQVLSGWLFYYDIWERDYNATHTEYAVPEDPQHLTKKEKTEAERRALIRWLGTGEAFKIYPYIAADGHTEWLSLTGRRPSQMSLEQWTFMQTTMSHMKELLMHGKNIEANELITSLIEGQRKYAGVANLPSEAKMQAERIYNNACRPLWAGIVALILAGVYLFLGLKEKSVRKSSRISLTGISLLLFIYVAAIMGLLWWIGNHLPLSNGPETMMFMSLAALLGAVICRGYTLKGALTAVGAMAMFVAAMAGKTPQIGALMPVLASPLLSVHVMLVMTSYVLFMLMAILSCVGLCSKEVDKQEQLSRTNRIILLPAVFLLAAGIFVGAVWANQSWGRYWGWDPKETCALITLIIYSVPLHWAVPKSKLFPVNLSCLRKPRILHIYLLVAILSVLFTYFGANYLLPGLHSYA